MIDVTSVGDVNVDVVTSNISDLPERDSQMLLEDLRLSTGGCATNFAKASAMLGLKTRLIGKIGRDVYGDQVRKELGAVRDLQTCFSLGPRTGVTLALTFKDKTRSFLTYTGGNALFSIKDVDYGLIQGRCLHVASFFLQGLKKDTKKLLDYAHDKGMIASFDAGLDPRGWSKKDTALLRKTLKDVDVFFPNLAEGKAITGLRGREEICDHLLSLGPKIVALKMGSKGCYVCSGDESFFLPAYKVKALDTTGTGDVFAAGFMYGVLKGWEPKKTARFASAAAALKTRGYGSQMYPKKSEVMRML